MFFGWQNNAHTNLSSIIMPDFYEANILTLNTKERSSYESQENL